MSVRSNESNWVRLGDHIEEFDVRNSDNKIKTVKSVSVTKEFKETNAKVNKEELQGYKLVPPNYLSYVQTTKNEKCFANALNTSNETYVVTQVNKVIFVKDPKVLSIEYLNIIFKGDEFDRYSIFNSWGSARETFDWSVLCDTQIPLPDIETQQELVDTYNGLKALAEQNEALIQPLTEACQAYIVDCKKKYAEIELGEYIEEINERNSTNEITLTQGVDVNMQFIPAKREAANKEGTKIVRTGQFAFNKVVKANGTKLPIALRTGPDCIISSSYAVFQIINPVLDPKFLRLWFSRSEVHRYCGFISQGTTRDVFSFEDLSNMKLPIPPIEVQQAIVDIYNCAEEAKKIATEAREKMKTLCPALVQKALKG